MQTLTPSLATADTVPPDAPFGVPPWPITITALVDVSHGMARAKGWHEQALNVPEKIALIHSEASEALEDYRTGEMSTHITNGGKPCGFPTELADIVIRVADLAGALGIDLEEAIATKMAYNATRSHRHGGKRA